ncbi:sulfoxide reductase heme-binding subunit YedZ [bacterium]|nr:sulfoxide reductase heme-binding subunit YedZ [bacterium]
MEKKYPHYTRGWTSKSGSSLKERVQRWGWVVVQSPGVVLGFLWWKDRLGANPVEALHHGLGRWTLYFLLATLLVSPLVRWTRWGFLMPARRTLGLGAFQYGVLHFGLWASLDFDWEWAEIMREILERRYIGWGVAALLGMVPLAWTSPSRAVKLMGGKRWRTLHQLVYFSAGAGSIHFFLKTFPKEGWGASAPYLMVFFFLLSLRAFRIRPKPLRPRA